MSILKENIEQDNVVPFPVKPALDEGDPDSPCWLKQHGVGAIVLIQRKNQGQEFGVHMVAVNSISPEKQMYGLVNPMDGAPWPHPGLINPVRFCNFFECVEVIRTREEYLHEKELNEQRDRTNLEDSMADDARPSGVSEVDEES